MTTPQRRAVFLDRDGVINRPLLQDGKPHAPRRFADFVLLPGVVAAIGSLKEAGLRVVVVTNQPDIGNGLVAESEVVAMHVMLRRETSVDDILVCPHRQDEGCACRKPKPGMLLDAAAAHGIDLRASFMIGDRVSDVLAGSAAGCYTIFLDRGYAETRNQSFDTDAILASLPEAARHILSRLQQND